MQKEDGLNKRGAIWWLRSDPVTGKRRSTGCKDKPAAIAYRAERERLAINPAYAAAHQATVGKWAKELLRVKTQSRSKGTADMYATKLGHVTRIFGEGCRMVDMNPGSVDRFISVRRDEGAKDYTIGKEFIAIRQMCKLAKRSDEWTGDLDTLKPADFSDGYVPRETTLTLEEVMKLFAVMPPDKVVATALAGLGCRRAELQRISREDIDLETWTIRIPGTKTKGSKRRIPVVLPAHRALLTLAAESRLLPVKWPSMSAGLPRYCAKAGVTIATPNDLRRSFATWNVEAGVARSDVAKLLGHTSERMVFQVYGRESAEALGQKIRRDVGGTDEPPGTDPSQSGSCSGGPLSGSSCFSGVSDGDRTRDNRSHSPLGGVADEGYIEFFSSDPLFGISLNGREFPPVGTDPSQWWDGPQAP